MKHDDTHFDSHSDSNPTRSLDPELEARVVASVLGEASPFETAELARLAAERPEVAEFKRSIEATHGLVCAAERPVAAAVSGGGAAWRMEPTRRAELLAKLGTDGGVGAADEGASASGRPKTEVANTSVAWWRSWALPMAACVALGGLLAAIVVPVGGTFGVAYKKPSRPAPVEVATGAFALEAPMNATLSGVVSHAESLESALAAPAEADARVAFQLPVSSSTPATPRPVVVAAPNPMSGPRASGPRADVSISFDDYAKDGADGKNVNGFDSRRTGGFVGGKENASRLEAVSGEVRRRSAQRDNQPIDADAPSLSVTLNTSANSEYAFRSGADGSTHGGALGGWVAGAINEDLRAAEKPAFEAATFGAAPKADHSGLIATGRTQYLAGDLNAAQESFREAEALAPDSAEARYFNKRIAQDKAKEGALTREKQRAGMTEEVAKSWQRPGVFAESKVEAGKVSVVADDLPLKKLNAVVVDESLRAEVATAGAAVSTFSLHVGDASFRLAKAALERGAAPDPDTIRPEEFYNAFDYGDPAPAAGEPVACRVEQAAHPFLQQRNLVRIALRVPAAGRGAGTPLHLTVLLDTSGSMEREDRAATVRAALGSLAALLGPNDRVTLVGFALQPRLLAEALSGDQAGRLAELAASTPAEGGTNLEEALKLAGELARRQWRAGAQNRIVLLTDGATNLGDADPARLATQVETLRRQGVAFDACGVGADGLDDGVLEALTRKGDGRYQVLNSPAEADAGFARKLAGAFRPAAENVKVQVRFNPARVARYRLIGFEKHRLREEDFRNDQVDAAELAAEEAAVALYQVEVIPGAELGELGDVAVRFRDPARGEMVERTWALAHEARPAAFDRASASLRLAGLSALLAEKLRGGALAGQIRLDELAPVAAGLRGAYAGDARVEDFLRMFDQTRRLTGE